MSKFYIIHLSDLHITNERTITLSNLITSLSQNKELQNKNVFLVITGDIINRGDYDQYFNGACEFFEDMKREFVRRKIKILDIHIVAGNHDKTNTASNKLFSIAQQSGISFPRNSTEQRTMSHIPLESDVLNLQAQAFEKHIELCNKIFEIFGICDATGNIKFYKNTYGVESNIIDETCIAFIRMNTAFSCNGTPNDHEKYHLTVGATQYDKLRNEYVTVRNAANSKQHNLLTFCLAHHPMLYLTPQEANKLNKMLLSENDFNVDYILTGHVHDAAISNLSDHNRNVINLETGIGWPDDANESHKNHRYAIYGIDEEKSLFCSMMYKTNLANKFEVDIDYLLTEEEKQNKKICTPLKRRDFAFIDISTQGSTRDFLFVNDESMGDLKKLYETISAYSTMCEKTLVSYKTRYIDYLLQDEDLKKEAIPILESCIEKIKKQKYDLDDFNQSFNSIFKIGVEKKSEKINELFKSYLQHITQLFVKYFSQYFENDSETRAVFRVYSKDTGKCIPVFKSPLEIIPRDNAELNKTGQPREYEYKGSLIEYAYKQKRSAIYSVNQDNHNFKTENWDDFIAIIPNLNKNIKNNIPPFSFVFSVRLKNLEDEEYTKCEIRQKRMKQTNKLFLLQFTNIEDILSDAIRQFTSHFNVNVDVDADYFFSSIKNN